MIVDLPDTTTNVINKRITSLREEGGAITLGRVLTLVVAPDSEDIVEHAAVPRFMGCATELPRRRFDRCSLNNRDCLGNAFRRATSQGRCRARASAAGGWQFEN